MVHRPADGCARDAHGRSHGRRTARDQGDDARTPEQAGRNVPGGADATATTSGRMARTLVMSPLSPCLDPVTRPRARGPATRKRPGPAAARCAESWGAPGHAQATPGVPGGARPAVGTDDRGRTGC